MPICPLGRVVSGTLSQGQPLFCFVFPVFIFSLNKHSSCFARIWTEGSFFNEFPSYYCTAKFPLNHANCVQGVLKWAEISHQKKFSPYFPSTVEEKIILVLVHLLWINCWGPIVHPSHNYLRTSNLLMDGSSLNWQFPPFLFSCCGGPSHHTSGSPIPQKKHFLACRGSGRSRKVSFCLWIIYFS